MDSMVSVQQLPICI